ncbi:MAG: GGDEF domain-containing protein [Bdellovibrionota bacterium]
MTLPFPKKPRRKHDTDKNTSELISEIDALRTKVRELQTELMLDDLTGLFNARHLKQRLDEALLKIEEIHPALLFIDVDFFKQVNEKHGHHSGGALLNCVGRMIAQLIRVDDIAFRYGGDEFVVLVTGGLEGAMSVGERIRKTIEETPFKVVGLTGEAQVNLTISVGIRVVREGDTPKMIIDEADRAMYEAKRRTRNTLVAA